LESCLGLEYRIGGFGTIKSLLEEVYAKAIQLKLWSIVRHAAGCLKKVVNSLTINVADLIIRGKPVTVGYPQEFFIRTPMAPNFLTEIIFKHWFVL
jgi:hypothetical protein